MSPAAAELRGSAGPAPARLGASRSMARSDAPLVAALQDGMGGDQRAVLEDADLLGQRVHLDRAAACRVRHAVEVAADADHAVARDAALEPQHRPERRQRQGTQMQLLLGKGLVDDPACGRVHARVGDGVEPMPELLVEVVEIAEAAGEEEVFADVAERSLHFPLGLGPVRLAGLWEKAVVTGEVDERAIVDDAVAVTGAGHRGLHAVVEDLPRRAADRLEGGGMAAQHRRQVLVHHEPGPDQAAVAEHHGEQPDDPRRGGLVGEHDVEPGEVHLGLLAGRGLEAHLERRIDVGRPRAGSR